MGEYMLKLQSGEAYCAAFCAFLALLAGSGNYASCKKLQWFAKVGKSGGVKRYARMSLG